MYIGKYVDQEKDREGGKILKKVILWRGEKYVERNTLRGNYVGSKTRRSVYREIRGSGK